jgi:protein SCO1/2
VLLYFGYLACPDFCPTTFAELRRVYAELGSPADTLKIVFVTVDPERDSLEALTNYTHAFNADFIGLRPEGEALEAIKSQFGVVAEQRRIGDAPLAYTVDHTASLFLIGPNAQLEAQYLYGTPYEDIVHDLRLILGSLNS